MKLAASLIGEVTGAGQAGWCVLQKLATGLTQAVRLLVRLLFSSIGVEVVALTFQEALNFSQTGQNCYHIVTPVGVDMLGC